MMLLSNVITVLKANKLNFLKLYEVVNPKVRRIIYNETRDIAGIYCWENKLNNKAYVGRSRNLCKRLTGYFRPSRLIAAAASNSIISKAIIKHGIGNFRLIILEFLPNYDDNIKADRKFLSFREGVWVNILKPRYNSADTGIGTSHNAPSDSNIANRIAAASRYKRTTFIECYDYHTNKYLFTFEGVRALARLINKVPGTIRHHLNKGTRLAGTLNGVYYELRVVRKVK